MKHAILPPLGTIQPYEQKFNSTGSVLIQQNFQEDPTQIIHNILALKAVEVAELGQIKVNGIIGKNIIEAAKECIYIVNLLSVAVQLYWNGKYIDVYKGTTIEQIIEKATN